MRQAFRSACPLSNMVLKTATMIAATAYCFGRIDRNGIRVCRSNGALFGRHPRRTGRSYRPKIDGPYPVSDAHLIRRRGRRQQRIRRYRPASPAKGRARARAISRFRLLLPNVRARAIARMDDIHPQPMVRRYHPRRTGHASLPTSTRRLDELFPGNCPNRWCRPAELTRPRGQASWSRPGNSPRKNA